MLTQEGYFKNWDYYNIVKIGNDLKNQIYDKYLVKCNVFNRDDFSCQNTECPSPDSKLTMHHIKWQKNGGEHKERNCITLCESCHKAFHRGKRHIVFSNTKKLPAHIRGKIFKLSSGNEIDWKKVKKDMKMFRKNIKHEHGIVISLSQVVFLMRWLENVVDLDDPIE